MSCDSDVLAINNKEQYCMKLFLGNTSNIKFNTLVNLV